MTLKHTLAALTLLAATAASQAAIVTYSDRAAWAAAAGAATSTQDFNSFAADTSIGGGVNLGGGMSVSGSSWTIDVPPLSNVSECSVDGSAFLCGSNEAPLTFSFAGGITAFGADFSSLNDNAPRTRIELFDGDTLIDTLAPPTVSGQADQFFGFVAAAGENITAWRTRLDRRDTFGIDNIAIVAGGKTVPEPTSVLLVGAALLALARTRRASAAR